MSKVRHLRMVKPGYEPRKVRCRFCDYVATAYKDEDGETLTATQDLWDHVILKHQYHPDVIEMMKRIDEAEEEDFHAEG